MNFLRKRSEAVARSGGSEVDTIDAAYADHLRVLFRVLIDNLSEERATHDTDQDALDRFSAGLKIARRARELARSAVEPQPRARAVASARRR